MKIFFFENEELEIDETLFLKQKRVKQNAVNEKIDIGFLEWFPCHFLFYKVQKQRTILPIIRYHCRQECRIYSDSWATYLNMNSVSIQSHLQNEQLPIYHCFVNNSLQYVDHENPLIHTNTI
ncbi:hypothetical protein ABPG74_006776 [Tetrahymena malaccensis]